MLAEPCAALRPWSLGICFLMALKQLADTGDVVGCVDMARRGLFYVFYILWQHITLLQVSLCHPSSARLVLNAFKLYELFSAPGGKIHPNIPLETTMGKQR